MLSVIGAILSAILSIGTSATGLLNSQSASTQSIPVQQYRVNTCYNPELDVKLTLKYPDNFTNVTDNRSTLNPAAFGNVPPAFTSDASCQQLVMNGTATRDYIRVRQDVRISSCKTDELAGPYGSGVCPGTPADNAQSIRHRGMCTIDGYTDLRKVADIPAPDGSGGIWEIFWNPFSYNVGCNYQQNTNCGPGQRQNLNLKDFIYVLKMRDAFTPQDNPGCPVLWDAGSTNKDACSHHFDVYMAKDLYDGSKAAPATNDPESPYYFIKQVLENCNEQTTFIPAPEANLTMPPIYIKTPFVPQNNTTIYATDKIVPANATENTNYLSYIYGSAAINPFVTNLIKTADATDTLTLCPSTKIIVKGAANRITATPIPTTVPPTIAPQPTCYDSLGTIAFKDSTGAINTYRVFSRADSPQTFTFQKSDDTSKDYVYTITDKAYPSNNIHNPSLQLRVMQMIMQNQWTWATPWCKPAIYLYPQKSTNMSVKLTLEGSLTASIPAYDRTNGWNVTANPDGSLVQSGTGAKYPYLYYEAELHGIKLPEQGFVVAQKDLKIKLTSMMTEMNFSSKETSDFLAYWLSRLTGKPYYFITLIPENVINEKEHLTFSTNPDSLIRARFVFEGLDFPVIADPLPLPKHERNGFVATDWGGTLVGKSCTDISVK